METVSDRKFLGFPISAPNRLSTFPRTCGACDTPQALLDRGFPSVVPFAIKLNKNSVQISCHSVALCLYKALFCRCRSDIVSAFAFNQDQMYHCSYISRSSSSEHVLYIQVLFGPRPSFTWPGRSSRQWSKPRCPPTTFNLGSSCFRLWRSQYQLPLHLDLGHRVSVFLHLQEHRQVNWPFQVSEARRHRRYHRRQRSPSRSIPRSRGRSRPEGVEVPVGLH